MPILNLIRRVFGLSESRRAGRETAKHNSLENDIHRMANWVADALSQSGYNADFSPNSIDEIERFFLEQSANGEPLPNGLLSEDLGARLFALGSYCGETLRRDLGGVWLTDDDDPDGEMHVAVQLRDGTLFWPVERAMKRLAGEEDNLSHWARVIRRDFSLATGEAG